MIRTILRTLPGEQWAAAREFRRRLKARLDQEGIDIPYPQRMVHVRPQGAELPMSLRLFNTMTRTVEPLVPVVPGRVTLVHLRSHDLELRPHREFPDLRLRGSAAALAQGVAGSRSTRS